MESIYHNIVREYCDMAMAPIPIKFKSKQPAIEGWTKLKIEDRRDIERYFVEPINIGILTGKPSNNLIDVDIDHPGALKFASYFLLETHCVFGRASKRRSHWIYRVVHPGNRMSFAADRMIVEVRGNGCCSLFPESIHPSGEKVEFDNPNDFIPDRSTWAKLTQAAKQIAIATVLYPYWSEESHCRHGLALAVAAFLARREWKKEDVTKLVETIAKEANDEELEDRLRGVDHTFAAYAQGRSISGDEELVQLIGAELAQRIVKWITGKASKKTKKFTSSNPADSGAGGAIDITNDAAAADAAFKDRLVYCNGQWFHREVQVLEPIPVEYVQGRFTGLSRSLDDASHDRCKELADNLAISVWGSLRIIIKRDYEQHLRRTQNSDRACAS
jgi:Bifunctional DNA primase/polymerase, N-terminal